VSAEGNGGRRAVLTADHEGDDFAVWITSDVDGSPVTRMLNAARVHEDPGPPLPAGVSHLLAANDALIPGRFGAHATLCGLEIRRPNATIREEHECQMSCDCVRFCPECAKEAARWSADAGDRALYRPVSGQALDSPEVAAAKRLLDTAKESGFAFERTGPGEDAPLLGVRQLVEWIDEIVLAGFSEPGSCCAVRRRRCSLLVPGGLPVAQRVSGDALTVLHVVLTDWVTR
jgi:hypothetical protein